MKTSEMVSPMCLATRLNGAVLAKRAGDVGRLMREYAWVGLRMGRAKMIAMAHEVERLTRVDTKHRAVDLDRQPAAN